MKVTLKKASELSRALLTASEAPVSSTITLSCYLEKSPEPLIEAAEQKAIEDISRSLAQIEAAYAVRTLIAENNAKNGVTTLLTELAQVDATIERLVLVATSGHEAVDSIHNRLIAQRARAENQYGSEEISTGVFKKATLDGYSDTLADLRIRRNNIKDMITGLNFTTTIEIPDSVREVLKVSKII